MSPCENCRGDGYLLDQGYGFTPIPDGAVTVQRCDNCQNLGGDIEAAEEAANTLGTSWGYRDDHGKIADEDGGPGDVWVVLP